MQLTAEGPTSPIMLVSSNVFPPEAADIKRTSYHNSRPTLGTQASVHSPSNTQANWVRRPKTRKVWLSLCFHVFRDMRM